MGRLEPVPGGTNVIASRVDLWLDVRHPDDAVTAMLVEKIHGQAQKIAAFEGCTVVLTEESFSGTVHFDAGAARARWSSPCTGASPAPRCCPPAPGTTPACSPREVPSGMLYVRNPSGISHSPEEYVEDDDADAGVAALADALEDLL